MQKLVSRMHTARVVLAALPPRHRLRTTQALERYDPRHLAGGTAALDAGAAGAADSLGHRLILRFCLEAWGDLDPPTRLAALVCLADLRGARHVLGGSGPDSPLRALVGMLAAGGTGYSSAAATRPP